MLTLVNNTGSTSVIGKAVILDPTNPNAFLYAPPNSTKVLGIVMQSIPYRQKCKIATSGEKAKVLVSGNIVKDAILRLSKTTDRISLGVSTTAKVGDTPYLRIGVALESGNNLVLCLIDTQFTGNESGIGYVPYIGATGDVDLGDYQLDSGGVHIQESDTVNSTGKRLTMYYFTGVGGFIMALDWDTAGYEDLFLEGDNIYFGVYSNALCAFYGDLESHDNTRLGSATDHVLVDGDGEMSFVGDATRWDDIRIIPNVFDVPGLTDPDIISYQPAGSGATFKVYAFAKGDEGFFTIQFPHSYKVGSTLKAHVHWTPGPRGVAENGNVVQWRLDYSIAPIGSNFPASSTIPLPDTCDGVNHKHQMTAEVDIPGVGTGTGVSAQMWGRIYRWNDASDTWAGIGANLPIFIEFDIHYEIDSVGSKTSSSK